MFHFVSLNCLFCALMLENIHVRISFLLFSIHELENYRSWLDFDILKLTIDRIDCLLHHVKTDSTSFEAGAQISDMARSVTA